MANMNNPTVEEEYLEWLRLMAKRRISKLWDAVERIREEALRGHSEYEDDLESLNRYIDTMHVLFRRIAKRQCGLPDTIKEIVIGAVDKAIEEARIGVERRLKEINVMPVDDLKEIIISLEKILLYSADYVDFSKAMEALKKRLDIN
ncbi:MAG: hypothetical protein DRN20_06655 [Thermoplasmata archaeon]|nr:MAG: hypothetical protein DRN20_06655 [Thermoplasmata archaeon]